MERFPNFYYGPGTFIETKLFTPKQSFATEKVAAFTPVSGFMINSHQQKDDLKGLPRYSVIMDFDSGKALFKGGRHNLAKLNMEESEHADLTVRFYGVDVYGKGVRIVFDVSEEANTSQEHGFVNFISQGILVTKQLKNCR